MLWLIIAGLAAGLACACKYTAVPMVLLPMVLASAMLPAGRAGWPRRFARAAVVAAVGVAAFSPWLIKNAVMTGNPVFPLANSVFRAYPPGWTQASQDRWDAGHAASGADRTAPARMVATWNRIVVDRPDHRFGIVLIPLAALLLSLALGRAIAAYGSDGARAATVVAAAGEEPSTQRQYTLVGLAVLILTLVLVVQWLVWLLATHLFARFAVIMIPAAALICGYAVACGLRLVHRVVAVVLIAGACLNFMCVRRMIGREVTVPGAAAYFEGGVLGGFDYLKTLNVELPTAAGTAGAADVADPDAGASSRGDGPDTNRLRVLMVGDAKAFYVRPDVEYCVVFNENPLAAAVREASDAADVVTWLRDRGITHVLVNWLEIARLRRTYGFPAEITPELFDDLSQAGLTLMRAFELPGAAAEDGSRPRYIDLYAVE